MHVDLTPLYVHTNLFLKPVLIFWDLHLFKFLHKIYCTSPK